MSRKKSKAARVLGWICAIVYVAPVLLYFTAQEVVEPDGLLRVVTRTNRVVVMSHTPLFLVAMPAAAPDASFDAEMLRRIESRSTRLRAELAKIERARGWAIANLPPEHDDVVRRYGREIDAIRARIELVEALRPPDVRRNWYEAFKKRSEQQYAAAMQRLPVWMAFFLFPFVVHALARPLTRLSRGAYGSIAPGIRE